MATLRQTVFHRREWGALAAIHGFVGFWAVAGGFGLLTGVLDDQYLDGSVFSSYTIPGLVLGGVIGGSSLLAALAVWRHVDKALEVSLFASLMLTGWLIVQLWAVGYISWMQPFFIALLAIQAGLAMRLRKNAP